MTGGSCSGGPATVGWPGQAKAAECATAPRSWGLLPALPQRWEDVPRAAYDPEDRLEALDTDGVDAEVLFQGGGPGPAFESGDPEYEMDVVRASNDALTEWTHVSDRYLPLVLVP